MTLAAAPSQRGPLTLDWLSSSHPEGETHVLRRTDPGRRADARGIENGLQSVQEAAQADAARRGEQHRRWPVKRRPTLRHRRHHAAWPILSGRLGRTGPARQAQTLWWRHL